MGNIIGVDGGGTKTSFCLLNTVTLTKDYLEVSETNFKNIGIENTKKNLESGLIELLKIRDLELKDIDYLVFGIAGCDTEEDYLVFKDILKDLGIDKKSYICNDAKVAFRACTNRDGIILISGTGSISFSYNQDIEKRLGGWGAELSDIGSGYWVGREFLRDLLLNLEHLYPQDKVFQNFIEKYMDNKDPFEYIQSNFVDVKTIASVTKDVLSIKTEYTDKLIDRVVDYFYTIIDELYSDFSEKEIDLILSGSVIKNERVYRLLERKISDNKEMNNINIILNNNKAVEGCLNIALDILNS